MIRGIEGRQIFRNNKDRKDFIESGTAVSILQDYPT
jgi:hypothetical protein